MPSTITRPEIRPSSSPAANIIASAWAVVCKLHDNTEADFLEALATVQFVYAARIASPVQLLERIRAKFAERREGEEAVHALSAIRAVMTRPEAFSQPLIGRTTDQMLIDDAVTHLKNAVHICANRDARTDTLREALRFLVWHTGEPRMFVDFWNCLSMDSIGGKQGRYQTANSNFNGIVRLVQTGHDLRV